GRGEPGQGFPHPVSPFPGTLASGGWTMKIGVLGSGQVGQVLADGFLSLGHEVMRGSREREKLEGWLSGAEARGQGTASIGTFQATAKHGELLVLAVKGAAAVAALKGIDPALLRGKTILDTTNPIAEVPPVDGVISFLPTVSD